MAPNASETKLIKADIRAPYIRRLSISRPNRSTPRMFSDDSKGPILDTPLRTSRSSGLCGATQGANTAHITRTISTVIGNQGIFNSLDFFRKSESLVPNDFLSFNTASASTVAIGYPPNLFDQMLSVFPLTVPNSRIHIRIQQINNS